MKNTWFWITITLALLLRIVLLPHPGFEADVSFWKSWGLAVYDRGIVWAANNTNNNYPTPFAYLLGLMVKLYSLLANPHNFNEFWLNTNLLFLTVAKLPAIIADFGIAAIILWIGRNARRLNFPQLPFSVYCVLCTVYLLSPIGIIDGAWWGQVDSVGVFVFLLALLAALSRRPMLAGVIFMTAMMTKLQNMIYGPLFFLFIWQMTGYRGLIRGLAGATLAFFGLNIEFFLARDMAKVIGSLTENFDYFPLMSLNAYNLWWIVSGAKGMQVSDKLLALGIINAKTVGLLIFSSFYLFTVLRQIAILLYCYIAKKPFGNQQQYNNLSNITIENELYKQTTLRVFIENLIIVNGAFFLFQTQSHDRYAFPLLVFLLLWGAFYITQSPLKHKQIVILLNCYIDKRRFQIFSILYLIFNILYFYNLHTSLAVNYPQNGLPILGSLTQPALTVATAAFLLGLFGLFLIYIIKRSRLPALLAFCFLLFAIFSANRPLIFKKSISLTKLTPFVSEQGYGSRQTNMPVNASFGFPKWGFLSVQYAFYRKGIGTHAGSFINFDIGGHFKKFTTDYGIDTEAGGKGSAIFEIYGDDRLIFRSDKIGRYDLPRHAEVEVTGVKKLGLVTTDAGDGIADDHTDWLNPLLWP